MGALTIATTPLCNVFADGVFMRDETEIVGDKGTYKTAAEQTAMII